MARSAADAGAAALEPARAVAEVAASRKPRFELTGARRRTAARDHGAGLHRRRARRPRRRPAAAARAWSPCGMKPDASLYPLLADDAEPTRTGETLLVDLDSSPAGLPLPAAPARAARLGGGAALARHAARPRAGRRPGPRAGRGDDRLPRRAGGGRGAAGEPHRLDARAQGGPQRGARRVRALGPARGRGGRLPAPGPGRLPRRAAPRSGSARGCSRSRCGGSGPCPTCRATPTRSWRACPRACSCSPADLHVLSANRAFLESFRLARGGRARPRSRAARARGPARARRPGQVLETGAPSRPPSTISTCTRAARPSPRGSP